MVSYVDLPHIFTIYCGSLIESDISDDLCFYRSKFVQMRNLLKVQTLTLLSGMYLITDVHQIGF